MFSSSRVSNTRLHRALHRARSLLVAELAGSVQSRVERLEAREMLDGAGWGLEPRALPLDTVRQTQFVDIDGDGDTDLFENLTVSSDSSVRVSLNDGQGNFTRLAAQALNRYSPYQSLLFDINLDGKRDVVFLNENRTGATESIVWRFAAGNGDGTFAAPEEANIPVVAGEHAWMPWDYDGDGRDDVVLTSGLGVSPVGTRVLRHTGDNQFAEVYRAGNIVINTSVKGKIDAGNTDDVQLAGSFVRSYFRWNGSAFDVVSFGSFADFTTIRLLDFNADGRLDLHVQPNGPPATVRLNDGAGNFGSPISIFAPAQSTSTSLVGVGDFTGDGRQDLLFRNILSFNTPYPYYDRQYEFQLYRGDSSGAWNNNDYVALAKRVVEYSGPIPEFFSVRLNGDSVDDLIAIDSFTGTGYSKVYLSTSEVLASGNSSTQLTPLVAASSQVISITGLDATSDAPVALVAFFDANTNGIVDASEVQIGSATATAASATLAVTPPEGMVPGAAKILVVARREGQASDVLAINATSWTRSFFPEGFRGTRNINEYVPITNDNPFPVEYRVVLRYETGERDQVIASGTIPAFTRGAPNNQWAVTTSERGNLNLPGRVGVPYTIELQSSAPLAAMLVRYDRNFAVHGQSPGTGESLTTTTSTRWALADVRRGAFAIVSDYPQDVEVSTSYILLYNAAPSDSTVQVHFYRNGQRVATTTRTVGALRRAGVNLDDVPELANYSGPLSAVIESNQPITVSHTTYVRRNATIGGQSSHASMTLASPYSDTTSASSIVTPGVPARGTGVVPGEATTNITGNIRLFNPTSSERTVTITSRVDDGFRSGSLNDDTRVETIVLPAFARRDYSVTLRGNGTFGTSNLPPVNIRVDSSGPIIASSLETRGASGSPPSESNVAVASSIAATRWAFGDGFRHSGQYVSKSQETLYITNVASVAQDITLRFYSPTAGLISTTINVSAGGMRAVDVFAIPELAAKPNLLWFGTSVEAAMPIVASLSHFDGLQPGGWSSLGTPMAGVVAL